MTKANAMRNLIRPEAIPPCIPLHVAFLEHALAASQSLSLPTIYFFLLSLLLLLNPGQLLPEHLGHAAFLAGDDLGGPKHSPELQATPVGEGGEVVPHRKTFAD